VSDYRAALLTECDKHGVDPVWMEAIIQVESAGRTYATRYEPGWSYYEVPEYWANRLGQTVETEMNGQRVSWGLCQIMGGTARHLGFSGYFPELCLPSVGVHFGVLCFSKKLKKYDGNYQDAVAAYNAGTVKKIGQYYSNQRYVDKVVAQREKFLAEKSI
jgi:soluble lytic murein transglycosylase-like protein